MREQAASRKRPAKRRGAADCGEHRETAGAFAETMKVGEGTYPPKSLPVLIGRVPIPVAILTDDRPPLPIRSLLDPFV